MLAQYFADIVADIERRIGMPPRHVGRVDGKSGTAVGLIVSGDYDAGGLAPKAVVEDVSHRAVRDRTARRSSAVSHLSRIAQSRRPLKICAARAMDVVERDV